ncbi:hypothetical protein Slin15195_G086090 [Septoria linicola]|uniref:Uncharacterized protein n=1 Tax=Septoria linicola TaxID=215465 RepID=A0A9Q9ELP8_9PEZI|nr:hypothetical protein Slin14017_G088680 [Septoria linicola]USW55290.1 hypothetical protein Slin15195_G086090 [Septoria linicola]
MDLDVMDLDMMDLEAPMNMLLSNRQIGSEIFSRRRSDAALRIKDYTPAAARPDRMLQIAPWLEDLEVLVVDFYIKGSVFSVDFSWLLKLVAQAPRLKSCRLNLRGLYVPAPLLKFDQLRFGWQLWPRLECTEEVYIYDRRHEEDWSHETWPTLKWNEKHEKFERVAFEPAML